MKLGHLEQGKMNQNFLFEQNLFWDLKFETKLIEHHPTRLTEINGPRFGYPTRLSKHLKLRTKNSARICAADIFSDFSDNLNENS